MKPVLILGAIAAVSMVFAQSAPPKAGGQAGGRPGFGQGAPGGPGGPRRSMSPDERVKMFSKFLSLTPAQEKKMKPIFESSAKKMKALRDDKKMPEDKKREAFRKLRDENNKKISAILTPEQRKKLESRRRGPGGPGGPGAPGRGKPPVKGGTPPPPKGGKG